MTYATRGGFAATFALFLVALVGAAVLAVTTLMGIDARRSTRVAVDAQVRQLLHAGAVEAMRLLDAPPSEAQLSLPGALVSQEAAVSITFSPAQSSERIIAVVRATCFAQTLRQTLTFTRSADGWRLESATLD